MKTIEIKPEWVLNELPDMHLADGDGNMSFYTDIVTDARWITLALDTLGISFQEHDTEDNDTPLFWFEIKIEDLMEDCPALYQKCKKLDKEAMIDDSLNGTFNRFFEEHTDVLNDSTWQVFSSLKWHLSEFAKAIDKPMCWDLMCKQYDAKFANYLLDINMRRSFRKKIIKAKRKFLRWCSENEYSIESTSKNAA